MDILCNNINCDGIGMRRADWDNFRECQDIVLNGQVIWENAVLSPAVKSQIYTEYAANPTLAAQIWKAANVYAKANPTTIPIINAHPKAYHACIDYVTEGLVFQMDCDWLCTAAQWQDRIGNIIFAGTNVQLQDGIPYFSGSTAKYANNTNTLAYNYGSCTLEIVYKATTDNSSSNRKFFGVKGGSISYGALSNNRGVIASDGSCKQFPYTSHATVTSASIIDDNNGYFNQTNKVASGRNSWGDENTNFIANGGIYNGYAGKIMSIRIYNRILTEQEILANQTADLFRWNS